MRVLRLFLGVFFVLCFGSVSFAACNADADVRNTWVEQDGFAQFAKVHVKINSARPGAYAKVYVEVHFRYERSDGWANGGFGSNSISIDTSKTSSRDGQVDIRAVNCSKDKPCRIQDVQVRKVSCYD